MSKGPATVRLEKKEFLSAMARAVNGVAVVSTNGPAGRFGITVSSVSSVSADPPLVLACVNRSSVAHRALKENGVFCVNLLSTAQRELADTFAGRPSRGRAYEFEERVWCTGLTGSPQLNSALATFDCVMEQAHDAGSHTVFIGRVTGVTAQPGDPLLYTGRSYGGPLRWTRRRVAPSTTHDSRSSTAA
jgi:flavin reductase